MNLECIGMVFLFKKFLGYVSLWLHIHVGIYSGRKMYMVICWGHFKVLCECFVCLDFFGYVGYAWVYLSRVTGDWVCLS